MDPHFYVSEQPPAQRDALDQAASIVGRDLASRFGDRVAKTLSLVVKLRSGRVTEEFRRHFAGLTFKTTYNHDQVIALAALVARLKSELQPLLIQTQHKLIELDFAEQQLEAYREAERQIVADRQVKRQTGMYVEAVQFVDLLYSRYKINRSHLASATPEDIEAIAKLLRQRLATHGSEDERKKTAAEAHSF